MQCEICGNSAVHWIDLKGFSHFRCTVCSHVFVYPRPAQDVLDQFYASGDYYDAAETQRDRLVNDARARLDRLGQLCRRYGLSGRLLDVGCASGIFLSEAIKKGWQCEGSERSESTAAQARVLSGAVVHAGILENATISSGPFPCVTAWEVIEHVIDPRAFFAALVTQVQPGGLLALSTPLINGIPARVMGAQFPMLTPPEHLSLFSRRSLGLLASEFGMKEVSYRTFSNLDASSLASGLSRKLSHCELHELPMFYRRLMQLAGMSLAWLPSIVDALGFGSEMEVVYRRT